MNDIHAQISSKVPWYRDWHSKEAHKITHWVIFIAIVLLAWLFLSGEINNWVAFSTQQGLVINLPKTAAVLSIDPQSNTVVVGDTFAANIILDTANAPIDAVDIYALHYDPTILQVVDDMPNQKGVQIEPGKIIPFNAANTVDETTGTIKFGQLSAGGTSFTGKGTLATIHFKAVGAGTSFLKFDFNKGSTVDTNAAHKGKDQLANVVDAIYTVTAK